MSITSFVLCIVESYRDVVLSDNADLMHISAKTVYYLEVNASVLDIYLCVLECRSEAAAERRI